jgi:two-component system, NarL family, sensor kinase
MKEKLLLIVLFASAFLHFAHAQQHVADSLEKIINALPDDTAKVNRLNHLVTKLQYLDPAKAALKAHQSIELAERISYPLGLATASRLRGVLYVDRSVLDSGKLFYDKAYDLVKGSKEQLFRRQAGLLVHNYGVIFHHRQQYDSATSYYLKAATMLKEIGEENLCFFPYANLSNLYSYLKDNDKALEYAREMSRAAVKMNDPARIAFAVNQEMAARILLKQYDSVYLPLRQNIKRAMGIQNHFATAKAYNLMAGYHGDGKQVYDSSIFYSKKALAIMEKLNNHYEICGLLQDIGYGYKQKGDYRNALVYLKKATALAKSIPLPHVLPYSLSNLVETEEKVGDIPSAFFHLKEYVKINDSLQQVNNRSQVNELEAKYQAANKELQINQLESDKQIQDLAIRQKNNLNYILVIVITAILIISMLFYRGYKQKQRLQQQRIGELEKEKQLSATEAVLKGEEQERTRLAKDLHDGLGGMLSGIKYGLQTMKGNLIMTTENTRAFERSMDMLDSSIKEMRRVAHNMMPEALVKFGLDAALRDYCNDINQSGVLKVNYQSFGLEGTTLDQTLAITTYRIIQELINNTLKHAGARTAIVQITRTDQQLVITVEDDGKGFDTVILRQSKGIGWSNIQHRVEFMKGKLDVISQTEKGTSVHIEFNI